MQYEKFDRNYSTMSPSLFRQYATKSKSRIFLIEYFKLSEVEQAKNWRRNSIWWQTLMDRNREVDYEALAHKGIKFNISRE